MQNDKVTQDEARRVEQKEALPANYGDAAPEQAALALLRYRPGRKRSAGRDGGDG